MHSDSSRRAFLKLGAQLLGGAYLTTHMSAIMAAAREASELAPDAPWQVLSVPQARSLAAMADQIYPPDDSPGAAEIGAVRFMDVALGGFMAGALPLVQAGLAGLDQQVVRPNGQGAGFADLEFDQQTLALQAIETGPFFATVHFLTLAGVFALPEYGGNKNAEGWRQIGFERRHVWHPPFGYYDARYQQESTHEG